MSALISNELRVMTPRRWRNQRYRACARALRKALLLVVEVVIHKEDKEDNHKEVAPRAHILPPGIVNAAGTAGLVMSPRDRARAIAYQGEPDQ